MADYKKMYHVLCQAIDMAIDELEITPFTLPIANKLHAALLEAEKIYVDTTVYFEEKDETGIIELKIDRHIDDE